MSEKSEFSVVGIGASAGGLRALEEFFDHMPNNSNAAFLVVQHLSPDFKSLMKELLERRTQMVVHRVEDGMALEPNHIYLIPPSNNLTVRNRCLHLVEQQFHPRSHPNFPINLFLESLAEDCQDKAIGIVLSGTGSDGSQGLQSISEAGGLSLVQSPSTAEFDGMPQSAIATGIIDHVLPPVQLAQLVYDVAKQGRAHPAGGEGTAQDLDAEQLKKVINILSESEDLDFSYYKVTTLSRRVHRRCSLAGYDDLPTYLDYLSVSHEEQALLKSDLLIGVTRFFRDRDAWDLLQKDILPDLLHPLKADQIFRVWVSACATGEEAYSMAMLLDHLARQVGKSLSIKIFATDIDSVALAKASEGVYPESIATHIPPEFLGRYFTWRDGRFHVTRDLREMIIFAPHNLTKNAGFTQMNLISCRNVLIYMRPQLQQQVMRTLHFSLASKGILFLGESETPGALSDEFLALNKKWKIHQKRRDVRLPMLPLNSNSFQYAVAPTTSQAQLGQRTLPDNRGQRINTILDATLQAVYKQRHATCILMDIHEHLLHTITDELDLLRVPKGGASSSATALFPEALRLPVSTALNRAKRSNQEVTYTDIMVRMGESSFPVMLNIRYHEGTSASESFFIVSIERGGDRPPVSQKEPNTFRINEDTNQRILELEYELQQTRENLQAAIEELETTNEEQQSTNEELLASNEELQSTNEELHSVNEELFTVNSEYQSKIAELTELSRDVDNLLRSSDIGVVFLDQNLRIRKFTQAATMAINLLDSDIERPIRHITHNLDCDHLIDLLHQVLKTEAPFEQKIALRDASNTSLLMRINPYRSEIAQCDGIVLTFVNIDELQQAQDRLSETLGLLEILYNNSPVGLSLHDADLRYLRVNQVLADINGASVKEHLNRTPHDIIPDLADTVEPILRQVIETGEGIAGLQVQGTTAAEPEVVRDWLANTILYPFKMAAGGLAASSQKLQP